MSGSIVRKLLGQRQHRRIFISYRRRGDGAGYGGRLADSLLEHFGPDQCFLDVDHIEPGVDFVKSIEAGIGECEVLIVVIGPDWTSQTDSTGKPRLEDPNDWVRIEVAAALKRNVRVIPVLVGGARIPAEDQLPEDLKALSRRQAYELSDSRWPYDTQMLLLAVEKVGVKARTSREQVALRQGLKGVTAAVLAGGVVVATVLTVIHFMPRQPDEASKAPHANQDSKGVTKPPEAVTEIKSPLRNGVAQQQPPVQQDRPDSALRSRPETDTGAAAVPCGGARVSWRHEGVTYEANLLIRGPHGLASVFFEDPFGTREGVDQDVHVVRSPGYLSYDGSNPRITGTNLPHPTYGPDTFRLERLSNGSWKIKDVGDVGSGHFDIAVPLSALSLADCR